MCIYFNKNNEINTQNELRFKSRNNYMVTLSRIDFLFPFLFFLPFSQLFAIFRMKTKNTNHEIGGNSRII
jgi:hypothetical protein